MLRALVVALLALASSVSARPRYRVAVSVDPVARTATGEMTLAVENPTAAPLSSLELWQLPVRLATMSAAIDEHNFFWVYPSRFDPAVFTVGEVSVDGVAAAGQVRDAEPAGKGTLLVVALATPLAPGGVATVRARFRVRLPLRYGGFGCHRERCTMAGGFHPMLVGLTAAGFDRSAPPAPADYEIEVTTPTAGAAVLIAGLPRRTARLDDAAGALVQVASARAAWNERRLEHRGVVVTYQHTGAAPPPPPAPPGKALPYLVEDRAGLVLEAAREALDLLADEKLDLPPGTTVPLVETAVRMELASAAPGAVLVSDELYRIMPMARFRKFHTFQLVRAIFDLLVEERLKARERSDDRGWSADVAASWLVDRFTLREFRRTEYARDLLIGWSFIPQIDRLLYAPMVQFASAYFNTLDEPDPTRDDLRRFANLRPRGKTIYEKLRDLCGDEAIAVVARASWAGVPLREAASRQPGAPSEAFFSQWLGPYPEVDYRFEVLRVEKRPAGHRYRLRVWKRGERPPVEPVEVRLTEWGGQRHDVVWDGVGREGFLTVETRRLAQSIQLDPRGRLLEWIASENDDARLDNRSPQHFKFIYNNFGALINFQTLTVDLSVDFTLNRIFDTKNSQRLVLYRAFGTQIGALFAYTRRFGKRLTPAQLEGAVTTQLRVARLEPTFGRVRGEPQVPATLITTSVGLLYDNRYYTWEPWRATALSASVTYSLTIEDNGRVLQQATVGAALWHTQKLAIGHALALQAGFAITFGDLRVPTQMLSAGSPGWLRGYEPDELLGRERLAARLEYRHDLVRDLDWNLLHVLVVRGISGGLFAEAAMISPCESYGVTDKDLFADVGYTLRVAGDWFGVTQTLLNIDLAVPLVRRPRGCFLDPGAAPPSTSTRSPIGVFVYFNPTW